MNAYDIDLFEVEYFFLNLDSGFFVVETASFAALVINSYKVLHL